MSLVFTTTSCDMDLTPDSAVPEHEALRTIDDCDAWVVGIYSAFKNSALYSGYMTLLPDIQADMAYAALKNLSVFLPESPTQYNSKLSDRNTDWKPMYT